MLLCVLDVCAPGPLGTSLDLYVPVGISPCSCCIHIPSSERASVCPYKPLQHVSCGCRLVSVCPGPCGSTAQLRGLFKPCSVTHCVFLCVPDSPDPLAAPSSPRCAVPELFWHQMNQGRGDTGRFCGALGLTDSSPCLQHWDPGLAPDLKLPTS